MHVFPVNSPVLTGRRISGGLGGAEQVGKEIGEEMLGRERIIKDAVATGSKTRELLELKSGEKLGSG